MVQLSHSGPRPPGPDRIEFLEAQPTYWLKRCYQLLRRRVDAELRDFGLTLSQRDVLLALWVSGPQDQSTLRNHLGLEQSSVSRLVDGLVRRGLVELGEGPRDRRVRIASLTLAGRDLLSHTPGASELGGSAMVDGLSHDEQYELVRLLKHCADRLESKETQS